MEYTNIITMDITCFFLFFTLLVLGCNGQDDIIGPSPADMTIQTGTNHTLECMLQQGVEVGAILWIEVFLPSGGAQNIYLGETKNTETKYKNFNLVTDGSTYWNLVIQNVEAEDGGTYACEVFTTGERESATRTVEAPPTSFTMTQDGNGVTAITAEEGETMEIVCTSVGSRPAVDIWWYQRQEGEDFVRITDGITQDAVINPDDSARFDTTSTIQYTTTKELNGGTLRCVTNGQTIVEPVDDTASLTINYIPVVSLTHGSNRVTCSSDANPAVLEPSGYKIIVNDTDQYTPTCVDGECTLILAVDFNTYVRCTATNAVGTGTKTIVPDIKQATGVSVAAVAVPLAIIAAAAIAFAIIVLWKFQRYRKEHPDKHDSSMTVRNTNTQQLVDVTESSSVQPYMELDQRTREGQGVYQEPAVTESSSVQPYMELDQRTREGQGVYQEPAVTESSAAQPYMELDQGTCERQGVYQDPQSATYEDIDEGSKPGDDEYHEPYQELGQPAKDNSASKAYVNVPQVKRGRNGNR